MGWHEGPLAGFDLETTSADVESARVVTAAVIVHGPEPVDASWLVNPGIDIPAEATAVHGISTETAQAQGLDPADALGMIVALLQVVIAKGIPLVIYNAPFDLTVMDRETRRHGLEPFGDVLARYDGLVVDPFVLDKHLDPYRKGKRTLTAATEHYKVTLGDAHEARSDVLAAMRVAWKIAALNPSVAAMAPAELHDLQVKAKAAQAAGFQDYLRRQGKAEIIDGSWPCKPYGEGNLVARTFPPVESRLMAQCSIQPNGCWHFTGSILRNGYGRIYWNGRTQGVHRVSYQLFTGPIGRGLTVNHKCHDDDPGCRGGLCLHRRCFNPDHLEAVTHRKNLDNGKSNSALNSAKTHCDSGHEFTLANTYIRVDGARTCRKCQAIAMGRFRTRQRNRSKGEAA